MTESTRELLTRRGIVRFPTYVPVTTFGNRYPLDNLIRPYLPRLASAVMVSYHYARAMSADDLSLPVWIDSGGFAALRATAKIRKIRGLGVLEIETEDGTERIHPRDVLDLQERLADVGFTLDFPVPPKLDARERRRRLDLSLANAQWAIENRRRQDLPLYGVVPGYDAESVRSTARTFAEAGFEGIALGSLVPRAQDREFLVRCVETARSAVGDRPLHVLGLGKPELAKLVFEAGADSVDSSSYVQLAAEGRLWSAPDFRLADPSPTERMHLALCNLAAATGTTLPLSAAPMSFRTAALTNPNPGH